MYYDGSQAQMFLSMLDNLSSPTICPDEFAAEHALEYKVESIGDIDLLIRAKFRDGSRITVTTLEGEVDQYDFADGSW